MGNNNPASYSQRILLLVTGMSPQIVTETLYALVMQTKPAFHPTEIRIISTVDGARAAKLRLLTTNKKFFELCAMYDIDTGCFREENIKVISLPDGSELTDIRTIQDNEAAANFITREIQTLCSNDNAAVHVSLAGGRKTMGYYAGYALSLFGRKQDRLSHVLVGEGYENSKEFFFPTKHSMDIDTFNKNVLDAKDAEVILANIPFYRLRSSLPAVLLDSNVAFSQIIETAQLANNPNLIIKQHANDFKIMGHTVKMSPTHYAFYVWVVARKKAGLPDIAINRFKMANTDGDETYMAQFKECLRATNSYHIDIQSNLDKLPKVMTIEYFREQKTRANKHIVRALGPDTAKKYVVTTFGKRPHTSCNLQINAKQVDWYIEGINWERWTD